MTTIYDGVKVLTYDEWSKRPAVINDLLGKLEDCPTCDGKGEHECECGHTHECGACDGSGKSKDFRDVYESLLRKEIMELSFWITGIPIKVPTIEKQPPADLVLISLNIRQ
jgi:hypothetical protein